MPKQETTVDFAEIFKYAETKHGIQWNLCNDLFFRTEVINYRGVTGWCLSECLPDNLLVELVEPDYEITDEIIDKIVKFTISNDEVCSLINTKDKVLADIASMIISQFAIEHNLNEFLILSK